MQRRGGVVHREQACARRARTDVAVDLADGHPGREALERMATEGHEQPRADDLELRIEERQVVGDLVGARVAVAGRARLDHVGDEDVLAGEAGHLQQIVEHRAGAPDERAALRVLVRARRLADDDHRRRRAALAGHEVRRLLADLEAARDVLADLGRDGVEELLRPRARPRGLRYPILPGMSPRAYVLAIAAGLGLADASIVTLALPDILSDLNTTVEGVAAVIGVYTVVLAITLIPFERAASALSVRAIGAGGFALFAVASAACAGARRPHRPARRALRAGGRRGRGARHGLRPARRRRARAAAVAGRRRVRHRARAGARRRADRGLRLARDLRLPGAGGARRARSPCSSGPRTRPPSPRPSAPSASPCARRWRSRWSRPRWPPSSSCSSCCSSRAGTSARCSAAAAVTVIPLGGARRRAHRAATRARARPRGCALVGGGVSRWRGCPSASLWWTVIPQALAGVGMGLSLTALGGDLLPERTPRDAARLLAVRHAGIARHPRHRRADRRPPARRLHADRQGARGGARARRARCRRRTRSSSRPRCWTASTPISRAPGCAARSPPSATASRAATSPPTTTSASTPTTCW